MCVSVFPSYIQERDVGSVFKSPTLPCLTIVGGKDSMRLLLLTS